jgi:hypothetical protein
MEWLLAMKNRNRKVFMERMGSQIAYPDELLNDGMRIVELASEQASFTSSSITLVDQTVHFLTMAL